MVLLTYNLYYFIFSDWGDFFWPPPHTLIRYHLGEVYQSTNRLEKAGECFMTALELEETNPIRPFRTLPRKLVQSVLSFF